uniref:Cytosolic fatty-acid binding proteins domain-containing protein n=1 Tax=Paramormyrops kingsleyae TaxID=1676925 RepID=A0A3B3RX27_9TELE
MTFNGTWKLEHSENFDKLMTQMVTVQQTNDNFYIKESSQKKDHSFTLGVPFDHELAGGTVIKGTWVLDGNILNGTFTGKGDGKPYLAKKEVTGNKLVQVSVSFLMVRCSHGGLQGWKEGQESHVC